MLQQKQTVSVSDHAASLISHKEAPGTTIGLSVGGLGSSSALHASYPNFVQAAGAGTTMTMSLEEVPTNQNQ